MFKIGDVVKYKKNKDYNFNTKEKYIIFSINNNSDWFTLICYNKDIMTSGLKEYMEIDKNYYRKEKIDKIIKVINKK